jgi:hypothetical protein
MFKGYAQNLVPNAGFEEYNNCPQAFTLSGDPNPLKNWYSPTLATPDYFNVCGSALVAVPANAAGVAEAHSGKAYLGMALYVDPMYQYAEYIQTKLTEPLIKDSLYCLNLYYRLASFSMLGSMGMGIYLSKQPLKATEDHAFEVTPQIMDTLTPSEDDALHWIGLQGLYKATGNEQYITIGGFRPEGSRIVPEQLFLPERKPIRNTAYYFVDDVSVEKINASNPYSCRETTLKVK